MGLLGCYLDDSHDQRDEQVFAVAGFFGWSLGFIDAENNWGDCLEHHGLKYFHAVECENVKGEFQKLRPRYKTLDHQKEAAAAIRDDFIAVINEATELDGIGLCISLETYRKVLAAEPNARIFLQDRHFYFAYHTLIIELVKRTEKEFRNHWIGFVCDDYSRRDEAEAAYDQLKEKNPISARRMASMTHSDDKTVRALQMADLIAYEARRAKLQQLQHRPVHKNDVMSKLSDTIWFMGDATEKYLREAIHDLVEQRDRRLVDEKADTV
jgi:tetratricopeptide (TPR) repeat protein